MYYQNDEVQDIIDHFPKKISQDIIDYVTEVVLKDSRYLFVKRSGSRQQYGYCTHCKSQHKTDNLKHNQETVCDNCYSSCKVKQSGISRKYLADEAFFVWYDQSHVNSNAITARGMLVRRDYSGDYRQVNTEFTVTSMYVFEPGQSTMLQLPYGWIEADWKKPKTIISEFNTSMQNRRCFCSYESIEKAVQGTPFQYSTWESYASGDDMVKFFELYTKYPCIEYLTKLGFSKLVKGKLYGGKTYSVINWRGKTIDKVLKLPVQEIKRLKQEARNISFYTLYLYQFCKRNGFTLQAEELIKFESMVPEYNQEAFKELMHHTTIRKIYNYVMKQYDKGDDQSYFGLSGVLNTWRDYINDCKQLNMTINDQVLFPKDLNQAHQRTIKRIKHLEDKKMNRLIEKRLVQLNRYKFERNGLFIRAIQDTKELIDEGNELEHCVGSYAKRYAEGKTDLFVIREVSKPSQPFYTVEIRNNEIIQAYGKKNAIPTDTVDRFLKQFKNTKLVKSSQNIAV